ncbi:hypothetical protein C8Q75DRAFT_804866 [Abortiporus biennis]|nr:hypothetical protein C8Q75DRAFT_804866 [Abortiporus biennis]
MSYLSRKAGAISLRQWNMGISTGRAPILKGLLENSQHRTTKALICARGLKTHQDSAPVVVSSTSSSEKITQTAILLAGGTLIGLLGYHIGVRHSKNSDVDKDYYNPQISAKTTSGFNETYGSPEDFRKAVLELKVIFGNSLDGDKSTKISTNADVLKIHGYSETGHTTSPYHPVFNTLPTVIVFPTSTEDVVKIVNVANKYKMPVVPYSGATSLEGHFQAPSIGSICVDMSNMDKVLEIHEEDSDLVCQPGARWMDINDMLKKKGIPLFFPLDPGPGATIGGMMSTGCSGTNAVRYGTAKGEWFLNATVVLPNGKVIKTRRRSRKSAAGFDTTKLFIGAEGTLGIITEVTIRLTPLLPTNVAVAQFPDVHRATSAVLEIMNEGVGIQCVELVDDEFMRATNLNGMSQRKWPEKDSLFFKFQGPNQESLKETARIVQKITSRHGASGFQLAKNEKEASDLWADRKNGFYSTLSLVEGSKGKDIQRSGIISTIMGHVGDGNFHALLVYKTDEELEIIQALCHRMAERAIALDGTCTGEHGIGIGKRTYLNEELGEETVELMKTVKRALDPHTLFNPGKLYPENYSHPRGISRKES